MSEPGTPSEGPPPSGPSGPPQLGLPPLAPPGPAGGLPPPSTNAPPPVPTDQLPNPPSGRRRTVLWVRIAVAVLVFGSAGIGLLVRTIREAKATPADKAACAAVLTAVESRGSQAAAMFSALAAADDQTLREGSTNIVADLNARNDSGFTSDLNKVIHRCNGLSSDFRGKFKKFCDANPTECKHTNNISPF